MADHSTDLTRAERAQIDIAFSKFDIVISFIIRLFSF